MFVNVKPRLSETWGLGESYSLPGKQFANPVVVNRGKLCSVYEDRVSFKTLTLRKVLKN
jgi:hypothetical protein